MAIFGVYRPWEAVLDHDLIEFYQIVKMADFGVPRQNRPNGQFRGAEAVGGRPRREFEKSYPIGAQNHLLDEFHFQWPVSGSPGCL